MYPVVVVVVVVVVGNSSNLEYAEMCMTRYWSSQ
jgi:hypothetical protein